MDQLYQLNDGVGLFFLLLVNFINYFGVILLS